MVQVALVAVHAMPVVLACLFSVGDAVSLSVVAVAHALARPWLTTQSAGRPEVGQSACYTGSAIRTIPAMASATAATCARESRSSSRSHAMTTVTAG